MGGQDKTIPKKMGRPPTGEGKQIQVRMHPELLDAVDGWIAKQPAPKPKRPEAVRLLLKKQLGLK